MIAAFRDTELSITDKFVYLIDIGYIFTAFVAVVAKEDALANRSFNEVVHEQKHHSEVVKGLTDQLLALLKCKKILQ